MTGGIKEWPADERPREKILNKGAASLSDAELLALILRTGDTVTRKSAIDLGRDIISHFGNNLRELGSAEIGELTAIKGMGLAKAAGIKAAFTLAARFQARRLENLDRFTSPRQVFDYFHHEFRDSRKEYFLVLLLDGKNRIIRRVQISEGSLNQSSMYHLTKQIRCIHDVAAPPIPQDSKESYSQQAFPSQIKTWRNL